MIEGPTETQHGKKRQNVGGSGTDSCSVRYNAEIGNKIHTM
jgi:hypothetical protein